MSDPLAFLDREQADTPSELMLDRYVAGELGPDERAKVERWVASSEEARARVDARRRFAHAPDADRLWARIEDRLDAPAPKPSGGSWWQRWRKLLGPGVLAVAAATAVLLVTQPWQAGPDVITPKGGFGFLVHRKTASASEVFVSGGAARAGDVLRFEVDLPEARRFMVIDQDPNGRLATAWPLDGGDTNRPVAPGARALEGAVELDDAVGDEWLHAVACTAPHRLSDFTATGPGVLRLPADCAAQAIHLRKVR